MLGRHLQATIPLVLIKAESDAVVSGDGAHLQVVEVVVQQHSGIGDAFLGTHKDERHHSLRSG